MGHRTSISESVCVCVCVLGGGEEWHFQERPLLLGYKAAQHIPGSAANFLWAYWCKGGARRTSEGLRKNDSPRVGKGAMGVTGRDWGVMVWTSSLRSGAWEKLERLWWAGEGGQGVTLTPWRVPEAQSQGGCRGSIWIEQMSLPGDCVCQALGVGNGGLLASGKIIPNPGPFLLSHLLGVSPHLGTALIPF